MLKKQTGFTLIELVIVIVILVILAVTAAPKFLNLQDDARKAAAEGVAAAIKSAANLVYSKAVIAGVESLDNKDPNAVINFGVNSVDLKFGYPIAADIADVVDLDGGWEAGDSGIFRSLGSGVNNACRITYTPPVAKGSSYVIKIDEACGK